MNNILIQLLNMVSAKADSMEFQDWYYINANEEASDEAISAYKKAIGATDEDDDYESYDSYEESYYDDDTIDDK